MRALAPWKPSGTRRGPGPARAFSRGVGGRASSRPLPRQPSGGSPPSQDKSACTLGRRPDVFNGDAANGLPTFLLDPRSPLATCSDPSSPEASLDNLNRVADQLAELTRRAEALHRTLDSRLRDMESIDLATGADVTAAQRTARVLQAALSLRPPPAASSTSPRAPAPAAPTSPAAAPSAIQPPPDSGSHRESDVPSTSGLLSRECTSGYVPAPSGGSTLHHLLLRTQAAAEALAVIGARHDAGLYAPLRRFYFSADEPLTALRLRAEQYRRQLLRAAEAGEPGSREVALLLEEIATALSSRTVSAFLEFEGATGPTSADALAASAASDWAALASLRGELEAVGRCAEAEGLPLTELLRLAGAADSAEPR